MNEDAYRIIIVIIYPSLNIKTNLNIFKYDGIIMNGLDENQKSFLKKIVPLSAIIGGLCCFTPVVFVLTGLGTASFAASLADTLYGTYKWAFRGAALLFLVSSLIWYFYKKENVCTIDMVKRKRRKIINTVLLALIIGIIAYIIWLYVIVELIGVGLGLWDLW